MFETGFAVFIGVALLLVKLPRRSMSVLSHLSRQYSRPWPESTRYSAAISCLHVE